MPDLENYLEAIKYKRKTSSDKKFLRYLDIVIVCEMYDCENALQNLGEPCKCCNYNNKDEITNGTYKEYAERDFTRY